MANISSTTSEGSHYGDRVPFRKILFPVTGTTYLAGALFGTVGGSIDGFRAADAGETLKTRLKRVLSSSARAGMSSGGRTGMQGLIISCAFELIGRATGRDEVSLVAATSVASAVVMGSGPRSAAMWAAVGGISGGIALAGTHVAEIYRHHGEQNPIRSLPCSGQDPVEIGENRPMNIPISRI